MGCGVGVVIFFILLQSLRLIFLEGVWLAKMKSAIDILKSRQIDL